LNTELTAGPGEMPLPTLQPCTAACVEVSAVCGFRTIAYRRRFVSVANRRFASRTGWPSPDFGLESQANRKLKAWDPCAGAIEQTSATGWVCSILQCRGTPYVCGCAGLLVLRLNFDGAVMPIRLERRRLVVTLESPSRAVVGCRRLSFQRCSNLHALFSAQRSKLKSILSSQRTNDLRRDYMFTRVQQRDFERNQLAQCQALSNECIQATFAEITCPPL